MLKGCTHGVQQWKLLFPFLFVQNIFKVPAVITVFIHNPCIVVPRSFQAKKPPSEFSLINAMIFVFTKSLLFSVVTKPNDSTPSLDSENEAIACRVWEWMQNQ